MSKEATLLGEEDFLPAMQGENRTWREQHVTQGDFKSFDGTGLRYYIAKREDAEADIVIVHGFCEFFGKYHEMAWYFWQAGYSVYFLEQRGHGYSEGKLIEPDIVHIDDYRTYVEDLHSFLEQIVGTAGDRKRILFAHSMGGAVAALFLESYPDYFRRAVLSSPMLRMRAGSYPPPVVGLIALYARLSGKTKALAPGQSRFDPTPIFETSSTLSKPRYDYLFGQRLMDVHYQTYGASFGWAIASMRGTRALIRRADRIRIPLALMTAGNDHLVDPAGYRDFVAKVPQTEVFAYEDSRHEIFNALEETRKRYFTDVLGFLSGV